MDVTLLSAVFFCNVTAVVFSVNCCCCCVVGLTSLDLIRRRVIFTSGISFFTCAVVSSGWLVLGLLTAGRYIPLKLVTSLDTFVASELRCPMHSTCRAFLA